MCSLQPQSESDTEKVVFSLFRMHFKLNVLLGKIINSQTLCTRLGPCENIKKLYWVRKQIFTLRTNLRQKIPAVIGENCLSVTFMKE